MEGRYRMREVVIRIELIISKVVSVSIREILEWESQVTGG